MDIHKWMYESFDHQDVIDAVATHGAPLEGSGSKREESLKRLWWSTINHFIIP